MSADRTLPFENGDRLDQPTFHARYLTTPDDFRAELIGGVVHTWGRVTVDHARASAALACLVGVYAAEHPRMFCGIRPTTILGHDSEIHPDIVLCTDGGQTTVSQDDYLSGGPEWVGEVTVETPSIDLLAKKDDYERYGVAEYVVVDVRSDRVYWFVRSAQGKFVERQPDEDGVIRSDVYAGLWLDPAAVLRDDLKTVLEVGRAGLKGRRK